MRKNKLYYVMILVFTVVFIGTSFSCKVTAGNNDSVEVEEEKSPSDDNDSNKEEKPGTQNPSIKEDSINWDEISYIASGNPDYENKYKFFSEDGKASVINIQKPFGTYYGIYVMFQAGVDSCDFSDCTIQGSGVLLNVDSFNEGETEINFIVAGNPCKVLIKYYSVPGTNPGTNQGQNPGTNTNPEDDYVSDSDIKESSNKDIEMTAPQLTKIPEVTNGNQLVFMLENHTGGVWEDEEIYVCIISINPSTGEWSYTKPDGSFVAIKETTSETWSYSLAEIKETGFQMPYSEAGRMYYSYGSKLYIKGVVSNGKTTGVILPSLSNPSDPNAKIYFDWLEFSVADNGTWVNTTQVDQFGFPVLIHVYDKDGSFQTTGISKSRSEIFNSFIDEMPSEFDTLVNEYRILAPCKGAFDERTNGLYKDYYKDYVEEVWNHWKENTAIVEHPQGKFELRGDGENLYFKCIEVIQAAMCELNKVYTIYGKPKNSELFEGAGNLDYGNPMEKALEAWICAALNRHVAELDPSEWNNASNYYQKAPMNYYSKFWHDHSENNGLAYGFCYDDVNDQSATTYSGNIRAVVIKLGF